MAETESERRKHPRVVAHLAVRSRPLDKAELGSLLNGLGDSDPKLPSLGLKKGHGGTMSMATSSLSVGGLSASGDLQVVGENAVTKGADVMVEIDMDDGLEPLRAIAQVMWSAPSGGGKHLAGMMFVVISEANLERIRKQVAKALDAGNFIPET